MKAEQISMLPALSEDEDVEDILRQAELFQEYAKKKRKQTLERRNYDKLEYENRAVRTQRW